MTPTLYGIPNCDTVKKARGWLADAGVAVDFHDYKKRGPDPGLLGGWADRVPWETLLNRSGTTFRKLPDSDKADLTRTSAIALMAAHPSAIRRPVLDTGETLLVGFAPDAYALAFPRKD
ncbi:MAG TPA: arsenate reductase [Sphingomonas sp.]|jgi:arsenate reductase|nr:arsenate reductase [Sphingomonas sp.]